MLPINDELFQILNPEGEVVGKLPDLPTEQLLDWYRWMHFGRAFSDAVVALQRQGRIGTFAPLNGQEATSLGLTAPLRPDDWLVASYRESLSYMVKGVPALGLLQQWGGDIPDSYAYEAHCVPFQIVLGTQMLHATGVAQAIRYDKKAQVVVGVCGDGATSEGDFHEALNLAGVFKAPVVFVVQNNGWAISTPRQRQSAAQCIAHRGLGFGIPSRMVDGNDVLAVYQVVAEAVARARAGDGPSLIEAVTYRLGAHTTADDPKKYRSEAELQTWLARDPIRRFRQFLLNRNYWSEHEDELLRQAVAAEVQAVIAVYEALPPQSPGRLFDLAYTELPPQLQQQRDELMHELEPASIEVSSLFQPVPSTQCEPALA
jgi:pyruvate dehydrogenase E1 component alpha subunit